MLGEGSYRELKVVDIAREAGTSPATFYQYFADVESAVVVLAEEMAARGKRFGDHVRTSTWRGRSGYAAAEALVDDVISFWEENRAVLRVVDLATDEGDGRFANVRTRLLNDLNNALAEAIGEMQAGGRIPADVDPQAPAGVLVSMLVHVAAHRYGFDVLLDAAAYAPASPASAWSTDAPSWTMRLNARTMAGVSEHCQMLRPKVMPAAPAWTTPSAMRSTSASDSRRGPPAATTSAGAATSTTLAKDSAEPV